MKRKDMILIGAILIIALLGYGGIRLFSKDGGRVVVTVDKKTVIDVPLSEDQTMEVPLTDGSNIIVIEDGAVTMRKADCPDQICVEHKPISKSGETIVCLPHKVVVEIISDEEAKVDIVS